MTPVTLSATGNIKASPGKLMTLSVHTTGSNQAIILITNSLTANTPVVFGAINCAPKETVSLPLPASGVYFSVGIRVYIIGTGIVNATYE